MFLPFFKEGLRKNQFQTGCGNGGCGGNDGSSIRNFQNHLYSLTKRTKFIKKHFR